MCIQQSKRRSSGISREKRAPRYFYSRSCYITGTRIPLNFPPKLRVIERNEKVAHVEAARAQCRRYRPACAYDIGQSSINAATSPLRREPQFRDEQEHRSTIQTDSCCFNLICTRVDGVPCVNVIHFAYKGAIVSHVV